MLVIYWSFICHKKMNHFNKYDKFLCLGIIKFDPYRERPRQTDRQTDTEHEVGSLKVCSVRMTKGFLSWDLSLERSYLCVGTQIPSVALEPTGFYCIDFVPLSDGNKFPPEWNTSLASDPCCSDQTMKQVFLPRDTVTSGPPSMNGLAILLFPFRIS